MNDSAESRPLTFGELGVPGPLVRVLAADDKKTAFPIQADTLPDSLAGRDILGRGRTGSGKTLAFSIPLVTRLGSYDSFGEIAMEEFRKFLRTQGYEEKSIEEILKMFEERLKEQTEEHNGGSYWIGTNGYSNFGNSGHSPQGIRVGGKSMYRRAFQVAGERRFRDFRKDNVLDIRQFQMAFRLLRQYSEQTQEAKTEFDVDGTVRETCDNAGTLSVCYKRPRKNTVKVLMLMDSGGSMEYYSNLCSMLFQAARQSNHFKELHVYYFHNCIYSSVYTDPRMYREHAVPTDWILQNFGSEYKVILVGDALMDMYELMEKRYDYRTGEAKWSGLDQIKRFCEHYDHLIWLNPEEPPRWGGYWGESYGYIARAVDMYPLTVDGLERGMKKLLVNR